MLSIIGINRHRLKTDGQGVTTLIALSSCQLNCEYCINKKQLQSTSTIYTAKALLDKVLIDYCYFVATGGGITFGGGEPLLQSQGIAEFIGQLPPNISINIETSLNVLQSNINDILEAGKSGNIPINWIIDVKDINPEIYKTYTKLNNTQVINNLGYIASKGLQDSCKIRIPLIPGYNTNSDILASKEYIEKLGYTNVELFEYTV